MFLTDKIVLVALGLALGSAPILSGRSFVSCVTRKVRSNVGPRGKPLSFAVNTIYFVIIKPTPIEAPQKYDNKH